MPYTLPSDAEKQQVWKDYMDRKPTRVPVNLVTNCRVVVLDERVNQGRFDVERAAHDPKHHIELVLAHALFVRRVLGKYSDMPHELPERWDIGMQVFNVYDAAILGAEIDFSKGQLPDTTPFLTDDNKHSIFDVDISHPLQRPYLKDRLAFWNEMDAICKDMKFEGRPVHLGAFCLTGTDGPLTVCCNIRGATEFLTDLLMDPDYADRLLSFVTEAAINRRNDMKTYWGERVALGNWLADDSCALISAEMFRERILPHHGRWFDAINGEVDAERGMHMCGDATRHFVTIRDELKVTSFDTGFPVNFGELRQELGDDIEIHGGPHIALLHSGTPDVVYQRTREILQSGIMQGGRFWLREGNNLPPGVPEANMEAMYTAALDFGRYS